MNLAMWSGPRNLSTALMYSFAARGDCDVLDEPFYGAYLRLTGADHPMRDAVLRDMECEPRRVVQTFQPAPSRMLYAKHMTHHMVPGIPRDWFGDVQHAFLIRHPARVIASYRAKRDTPTLSDLGFAEQLEIFEQVLATGSRPVVVDSFDIGAAPKQTLTRLCAALGIPWPDRMLSWPEGGHSADGIWAAHWYGSVHQSTGFQPPNADLPKIEPEYQPILNAALPIYHRLATYKI